MSSHSVNTAVLRAAFLSNPEMTVSVGPINDFTMDGRGNFKATSKRLTATGWVGKIVYGHINKRGKQVVHRVERIKDQSHG